MVFEVLVELWIIQGLFKDLKAFSDRAFGFKRMGFFDEVDSVLLVLA